MINKRYNQYNLINCRRLLEHYNLNKLDESEEIINTLIIKFDGLMNTRWLVYSICL
jgi:hypothetical protein